MRGEPFTIDVGEAVLEDLRARLELTRWPSPAPGRPWAQGTDLVALQELVAYWADWATEQVAAWPDDPAEATPNQDEQRAIVARAQWSELGR